MHVKQGGDSSSIRRVMANFFFRKEKNVIVRILGFIYLSYFGPPVLVNIYLYNVYVPGFAASRARAAAMPRP